MITKNYLKNIDILNETIREMLGQINDAYQGDYPIYPHKLEKVYKRFVKAFDQLGILDIDQIKIDYVATLQNIK